MEKVTDEDRELSKNERISIRTAIERRLEREQQEERENGDTHKDTSSGQSRPTS